MQFINKGENVMCEKYVTYQSNEIQNVDSNRDVYSFIFVFNRSRHKIVWLVIWVK